MYTIELEVTEQISGGEVGATKDGGYGYTGDYNDCVSGQRSNGDSVGRAVEIVLGCSK